MSKNLWFDRSIVYLGIIFRVGINRVIALQLDLTKYRVCAMGNYVEGLTIMAILTSSEWIAQVRNSRVKMKNVNRKKLRRSMRKSAEQQ